MVFFFGCGNYLLKGCYLLIVILCVDGFFKFGFNYCWGYFFVGVFVWCIFDELFFQLLVRVVDNLKLCFFYGFVGVDNIDVSLWCEIWKIGIIIYNGNVVFIYELNGMKVNLDLKWEIIILCNIGFDFGLWGSCLFGILDLYWNIISDLLMC